MKEIVITNSDEFELCITSFESSLNKIKDIFSKEKNNLERINGTPAWTGPVQEEIYKKNLELHENYQPIEQALQIYIDFLKKTLNDYKAFEEKVNFNAEQNSYNLNVNS